MHTHSGKSVFLITKPMQLIVALCIAQQDSFASKPLFIIVDAFKDAHKVAARLSSEFTELQYAKYFSSRQLAYNFINAQQVDNLFIDSDVGTRNFYTLASVKYRSPKISIHVYEEGLGTYRTDLYSGIQKCFYGLIGIGAFFGACRFVTSVYLYRKEEYIKKIPSNAFKAREIKCSFSDFLFLNRIEFKRLFEFGGVLPSSTRALCCSLYLSNWGIDNRFLSKFQELDGDLFVKLHPHIREELSTDAIQYINAHIPGELVIADLIDHYKFVRVYDHNSSTRRYITNSKLTYCLSETLLNSNKQFI